MAGMNTLKDLFEDELRDVYDAEKRVLKSLPRMAKAVSNEQLREALTTHVEETRGQIERLEQVFASIDAKPRGKRCMGMEGILSEGAALMEEDGEESVLDAGFIAASQRVEHYEITAYGTLMAWAKVLGLDEALQLLQENEQEEKAADQKLSQIAESIVNQQAAAGGGEEEEEEEEAPRPRASARGRTAATGARTGTRARAADRGRRR
jgi:ferritin-like metal-binding protein YciE